MYVPFCAVQSDSTQRAKQTDLPVVSAQTEKSLRGVMRLSTRGRESLGRSCVGALVALLAAGLFAPASARAGCSAYILSSHDAPAGKAGGLELLSRASDPVRPANRPKPCSGVFCSGNPGLPDVPSTPITPQGDEWGLLAEPAVPPVAGSFPRHHDDDRLRPIQAGLGVFHPPRASFLISL
jgi:hypothetical protein